MEKKYQIKAEFYEYWGNEVNDDNNIVTENRVKELSKIWDVPVEELLEQLEEI